MDTLVIAVFLIVYLGMILGRIPGLALDRTGLALLGAIVLLAFGRVSTSELSVAVDIPTLALLFGLMIVSVQFRLSGFYSWIVRWTDDLRATPAALLALIVATTALLSAVLVNDIICLAMTPVIIEICCRRGLDPRPYLLGLACASNIGSAATLIGNPQNILVGQVLRLSFARYLLQSVVPVAVSLLLLWLIIVLQYRRRWKLAAEPVTSVGSPAFSGWQTGKGAFVTLALVALFLAGTWPRELIALGAAGILLLSRRMRSREVLGLVDWQLLVLFVSLFIVNFALRQSGQLAVIVEGMAGAGVDLGRPGWLFTATLVLSNLVSNVPAVMLLLPAAVHPLAGPILALTSTLAGNLLVVGSIANIIVLEQARQHGVDISWKEHSRTGVPVTLATLSVAALWLWFLSGVA